MNEDIKLSEKIAERVSLIGGRAYYVGGYVRDKLMGKNSSDIDIEVHGISLEQFNKILFELGNPINFGKSFEVISLEHYNIDISISNLDLYNSALRRDITINSIMQDILTGEIIDNFGGVEDIKNRVIKHTNNNTFKEDPLRVLRVVRFASIFNYTIDSATLKICSLIDITKISKERIYNEIEKVLINSTKPSMFFRILDKINQLNFWFKEIEDIKYIKQNPIYHKEGNVFEHTMIAIDEASLLKKNVHRPIEYMFSVLCHDLGKITATKMVDGKISAISHDIEGIEISKKFLERFCNNKKIIKYVCNMVELHMRPLISASSNSKIKKTNKMFDLSVEPNDLIYVSLADNLGKISDDNIDIETFLIERLKKYEEMMELPYVTGEDLINSGIKPNKNFKYMLEFSHNLRLAGVKKEIALKETLKYGKKYEKNNM